MVSLPKLLVALHLYWPASGTPILTSVKTWSATDSFPGETTRSAQGEKGFARWKSLTFPLGSSVVQFIFRFRPIATVINRGGLETNVRAFLPAKCKKKHGLELIWDELLNIIDGPTNCRLPERGQILKQKLLKT